MHIDALLATLILAAMLLLASLLVLAACARSSQISARERRRFYIERLDRTPERRMARKVAK